MKKDNLNIVLWGVGNHAKKNLLPAINSSKKYNLYGILTRDKETLDQISGQYKCLAWQDSNEMLADPLIDIVFLSTPPALHFEHGMKILRAGKHLFCEKPLTINLETAIELLNYAEKTHLAICEALMYQYHSHFYQLKDLLRANEILNIRSIRSSFGLPRLKEPGYRFTKELGASCLYDVGIYPLSLIYSLFYKSSIELISKKIIKDDNHDIDISGAAHLIIDSKINCFIDWSYNATYRNNIDIWGENISLYSSKIFSKNKDYNPSFEICDTNGNISKKTMPSQDHFRLMLDYFAEVIHSEEKCKELRHNTLGLSRLLSNIKGINNV